MIKIEIKNENSQGYDLETHVSGSKFQVLHQMTSVLDDLYKSNHDIFEMALVHSKYAEDHT